MSSSGVTADDVGLACGPLYHVGALDLITTTMIAVGATTMVHRVFDAALVVEEIERSKVTCMWAAPAMVRAILEVPGVEERDLSSVRLIIAGGHWNPGVVPDLQLEVGAGPTHAAQLGHGAVPVQEGVA